MSTIAKPQLDALLRLAAGWRLVCRPRAAPRLYPPNTPDDWISLSLADFVQLERRGWVHLASQRDGATVYALTEAGRRAAQRDGATIGEVQFISPAYLAPGVVHYLRLCGIESAEQAHAVIRSGEFLELPKKAGHYLQRYFTRPRPPASASAEGGTE